MIQPSDARLEPRVIANSTRARGAIISGADIVLTVRPPKWIRHLKATVRTHKRLLEVLLSRFSGRGFFPAQTLASVDLDRGLTIILPGIEAAGPFPEDIREALSAGDVPGAKRIFYWGLPMPEGYLPNLMWISRNKIKAAELAGEIAEYQDAFPGRPVHIVANSGGAGPAIFAIEMLPPERKIESLVLLGGAVSDGYDLRKALERTRRGILNCHSDRDGGVLGLGTLVFGSADRRHSWSCGFKGFRLPSHLRTDSAAKAAYLRLFQIAWHPNMADECDHFGSHDFAAAPAFVRRYVAPWLIRPCPAN